MEFNCSYTDVKDVATLVENPKNNNKHPDRQIELLAKIIKYQGQRSPIVVSKRSGFITKGHGRLMAIRKLGWEKCAVDMQEYENEAQEYADLIADNKIAEMAELDEAMMISEIKLLGIDDFELLGLDDYELPSVENFDLDKEFENEGLDEKAISDGLVKSILIEFDVVDYEEAYKLISKMRKLGYQLGNSILQMLKADYERIKPGEDPT